MFQNVSKVQQKNKYNLILKTKMGSNVDDLINALVDLTQKEDQLLKQLSKDPTNTYLVGAIESVVVARESIYQLVVDILENDEKSINVSMSVYGDQLSVLRVLERSLNQTKSELNAIQENNVKKLRLIEINEYYGALYTDQTNLMMIIVATSVAVIVTCALSFVAVPKEVVIFFVAIELIIGIYLSYSKYHDISFRDNMNYQEYAWTFDASNVDTSNPGGTNPWAQQPACNC